MGLQGPRPDRAGIVLHFLTAVAYGRGPASMAIIDVSRYDPMS